MRVFFFPKAVLINNTQNKAGILVYISMYFLSMPNSKETIKIEMLRFYAIDIYK